MKFVVITVALLFHASALQASELDDQSWKVVNYWSKSCAPCRVEIPELNYLSEALAPFGVEVLGVDFDEHSREQTLQIAERMGITFPTLTIANVEQLNMTPPAVLPTTYILAPDNSVRAKLIGAQDRDMIMAKLAELEIGK